MAKNNTNSYLLYKSYYDFKSNSIQIKLLQNYPGTMQGRKKSLKYLKRNKDMFNYRIIGHTESIPKINSIAFYPTSTIVYFAYYDIDKNKVVENWYE